MARLSGIFRISLALMLALFVLSAPAIASGPAGGASKVVEKLQKRYAGVSSIRAGFTQDARSAAFGTTTSSRGTVTFKKPGRMRWSYEVPKGDEIVSNGTTFWLYQADLKQVVEQDAAAVTSTIATDFLTGVGELARDFGARLESEDERSWTLSLTPREPLANISSLSIKVSKDDLLVESTTTVDHFGNSTTVTFTSIEVDPGLDDTLFEFVPPKGAVVVRQ